MPQYTRDEARRHAQLPLRILARALQSPDNRLIAHAPREMRLRIEEDLRVLHTVRVSPVKVRHSQITEVGDGE